MGKREPRPQERPVPPVKDRDSWRRRFTEALSAALVKDGKNPVGTEPGTFKPQKGDLFEWVEETQVALEFKTIDNCGRAVEADMFGPKIAMAFNDPPITHARLDERPDLIETVLKPRQGRSHLLAVETKGWVKED